MTVSAVKKAVESVPGSAENQVSATENILGIIGRFNAEMIIFLRGFTGSAPFDQLGGEAFQVELFQ